MSISSFSRVTAYIGALVGVALATGILAKALSPQHMEPDTRLETFFQVAPDLQVITLGSSHSMGIYFPAMGVEGYSFYGGGMAADTSAVKLKAILPYTPELQCVILPYAAGSLDLPPLKLDKKRLDWLAYTPPYRSGAESSVLEVSEVLYAKLYENTLFSTIREARKNISRFVNTTAWERTGVCDIPLGDPSRPDFMGLRHGYSLASLPEMCRSRHALNAASSLKDRTPDPVLQAEIRGHNLEAIGSMLTSMEKRGGSLVVVATPLSREYREARGDYGKDTFEVLETEFGNRPGFSFVDGSDFFDGSDASLENEVYRDAHHLTLAGARLFSGWLTTQVPECGGVQPAPDRMAEAKAVGDAGHDTSPPQRYRDGAASGL